MKTTFEMFTQYDFKFKARAHFCHPSPVFFIIKKDVKMPEKCKSSNLEHGKWCWRVGTNDVNQQAEVFYGSNAVLGIKFVRHLCLLPFINCLIFCMSSFLFCMFMLYLKHFVSEMCYINK